jgi:1,5-anhydro-D-fructose reductase (1,5-anhydro-D-mannitol-forming)
MIKVGLVGLGFMGQMHFNCYKANPGAEIVAVGDCDEAKLSGNAKVEGNIAGNAPLDLTGIHTTTDVQSLLDNPEIDLVDFCLPTRAHAEHTIAALKAGKHVLCEKPLAWTLEECDAVIAAQQESGKALLIGHCLQFWPQYMKAKEIIDSGDLGDIVYARFIRVSGAPTWSEWLMNGEQSGGAVFDMHVHDIDTALWWFGKPDSVTTTGLIHEGLPLKVDAAWNYENGPQVHLHGGWDANGGDFVMAFEIIGSKASLNWDSSRGEAMHLFKDGKSTPIEVSGTMGYQAEIDYLIECINAGQLPSRATAQSSKVSVELAREELKQLGFTA